MEKHIDLSALAIWEQNHRDATVTLSEFAEAGDVDWVQILADQESMLDTLLTKQDRRLINRRRLTRNVPGSL